MSAHSVVSIIVPVYNVAAYLEECIESILHQTFRDFELLLINDGSTDNSGAICDRYSSRDARIIVIHKENGGLSSARNAGLDIATGDYIVFVDSDDEITENAVETLYNELIATSADVVMGKTVRFTLSGAERPYSRLAERREMSGEEALKLILEGELLNISVCGCGYKHSVFENIRFPERMVCEDWCVMPDIYKNAAKVIYTPRICYRYRENESSIMGSMMKKANPQVITVAENVIEKIKIFSEELYLKTIWSNARRVWKYVGFAYSSNRLRDNREFLLHAKEFFIKYERDIAKSESLSYSERVGLWSFCHFNICCRLLYSLKYKTIIRS